MAKDTFTLAQNQATKPFSLKSVDALALDFQNLDKKGLKKFADRFKRKKKPVTDIEANNKAKRANGVLQKQFTMTFEDGQKVTIAVKSDGTIFQVRLNNKVMPLRNTTDMSKAVDEIVNAMLANSSAYEKAKAAREKAKVRPPRPKVTTSRKQKLNEAREQISTMQQQVDDLKTQSDNQTAELEAKRKELADLQAALKSEQDLTKELEAEIKKLENAGATLPGGNA